MYDCFRRTGLVPGMMALLAAAVGGQWLAPDWRSLFSSNANDRSTCALASAKVAHSFPGIAASASTNLRPARIAVSTGEGTGAIFAGSAGAFPCDLRSRSARTVLAPA